MALTDQRHFVEFFFFCLQLRMWRYMLQFFHSANCLSLVPFEQTVLTCVIQLRPHPEPGPRSRDPSEEAQVPGGCPR
jgi:hypothetical protein